MAVQKRTLLAEGADAGAHPIYNRSSYDALSKAIGDKVGQVDVVGIGLLALTALGSIAYFFGGLMSLGAAWSTAEYSHGPLIPILSFVLFLKHLKVVSPQHPSRREQFPGLAVAVFALAVGAVGNVARIPDIITYGMIVWVFGLLLVTFGFRRGALFWAAVVHLVFMLPLPAFIYWKLSITLQFISAEMGVALIRMVGIPVFLDGNIIDLGPYKLDVAEACSGLRYLFPIMSFSYIFCMLYSGPIWHKAVLLASAAPITMAMNSFRIGVIGVLVDSYGIGHAEGFLHAFEGWVIFIACIGVLFGLARLLQVIGGDKRSLLEVLELNFEGLGPQLRRVTSIKRSPGLGALCAVTVVAGALAHLTPTPTPAAIEREPLVLFPSTLGSWRAAPPQRLPENIEAVLGADDYYASSFQSASSAAPVDFFVAWYRKQTEGSGIHSPEVCIPAGGWEMSEIKTVTLKILGIEGGSEHLVPVNRATIRRGFSRQLVYYWFEQRGRRLTSDYEAKAATILDAIRIGRTDGALVRLMTPIVEPNEVAAEARLAAFMAEMLPILPKFVPGQSEPAAKTLSTKEPN